MVVNVLDPEQMERQIEVQIGVVVARERIDHPWQDHRWRPAGVFLDAPEVSGWRELVRTPDMTQYHAATMPLLLHHLETEAYRLNLESGRPEVYVVLRETSDPEADAQMQVHLVTASADEAAIHGQGGDEIVEGVAMPDRLAELVAAFVAAHHVDKPFIKRKREKHHKEEEHLFGQEPLHQLRARQEAARAASTDGDDD